jgi:hypothetical protein
MFLTRRVSAIFGERRTSLRILLATTSNKSCRRSEEEGRSRVHLLFDQIEDVLEVVAVASASRITVPVHLLLVIFQGVDLAQLIRLNF